MMVVDGAALWMPRQDSSIFYGGVHMMKRFVVVAFGMAMVLLQPDISVGGWGVKQFGGAISQSAKAVSDRVSDAHLTPVHHSQKYYDDRGMQGYGPPPSHLSSVPSQPRLVVEDGGTIAPRPQPAPQPQVQPATPPWQQQQQQQQQQQHWQQQQQQQHWQRQQQQQHWQRQQQEQQQAEAIVRGVLMLLGE